MKLGSCAEFFCHRFTQMKIGWDTDGSGRSRAIGEYHLFIRVHLWQIPTFATGAMVNAERLIVNG